jgi:hypothetical protein
MKPCITLGIAIMLTKHLYLHSATLAVSNCLDFQASLIESQTPSGGFLPLYKGQSTLSVICAGKEI